MLRALAPVVGLVAAVAIAGCGGGGGDHRAAARSPAGAATSPTPSKPHPAPNPAAVRVIKGWTDTLRHGDVAGASRYFAVPVIVQNSADVLRLRSRAEVEFFNRTLPCGAVLIRSQVVGVYTVGVFRLTERPGAGSCGSGTGEVAAVAFVVHANRITQWRRLAGVPRPDTPPESPPTSSPAQI